MIGVERMSQNWNYIKKLSLILALSIMVLQLNVLLSAAQGAQNIGHSRLVMAENSSSIALNSYLAIPFNVVLSSGQAGTTDLIIANGNALASNGIYVGISPSSGTPSFSGTLYINTNLKPGVVPGTYQLMIESGGADPITGIFNFTLTVLNQASTSTKVSTSSTSYSVTSAPTTVAQSSSGSSSLLSLGAAGIIVILIIIIVVFLAMKAKK